MDMVTTVQEADNLYARYGKPLEPEHHGEYAAITFDGRVVVGKDDLEVGERALQQFGKGGFVLYRIGSAFVDKVRRGIWW
jgi:hypothetical protein